MAQPFVPPCERGLIDVEPCTREIAGGRKRMVLAACVLASAMAFIDGSALTVALPRLRAYFGADLAAIQWVLTAYVVALAALTLIGGALADVYGKARMLGVGSLGFGAASAACIFAPTVEWLIAARVLQGVSAALLTPASLRLDRRDLSEGGAQSRHRRVGGGLRADHRRRTGAGRLADANFWLAICVRHQPAAGADRGGAACRLRARRPARAAPFRRRRRGHSDGSAGRARLGAQPARPAAARPRPAP